MERTDFASLDVSDQVSRVSSGLAQGQALYLEWFCSIHDPRDIPPLTERFDEVLTAVRSNLSELVGSVLDIDSEHSLEFVLLLRIIGRLGMKIVNPLKHCVTETLCH